MASTRFAPLPPLLPALRSAVEAAVHTTVQTPGVRAALDALTAAAQTPFPALEQFSSAAGADNPSVRVTWLRTSLALIEAEFPTIAHAA